MLTLREFRFFICEVGVDAFILCTNDGYLNEFSENLVKLCGFVGTNGVVIVTKSGKCPFFTDVRYIENACDQLDHATFQVFNSQKKSPQEWVRENLLSVSSLGYYSEYFTVKEIRKYEGICKLVPCLTVRKNDYKNQKIISYVYGEDSESKCKKIAEMIDKEAEAMLLTDPNSISWLLNLRNENTKFTPCIIGRAILYKNGNVDLFLEDKDGSIMDETPGTHINIFDITQLETSLCKINSIMIDLNTTPMNIMTIIQNKHIVERDDPCLINKAIKNQAEITGSINSHIKDGAAFTNFLYWLQNNIKNKITELDAEKKLLEYKEEQASFRQLSFPTISAFSENGAIIHYRASNRTNKLIQQDGLYLIDSGTQYLGGTTDATRTVAIGNPTDEQIAYYTVVLKAHIALARAIFPFGTTGGELDILARIHLWKFGVDYLHATGHGVGSYLSVHEGPQAISKGNKIKLMPGMILSNEPGYYISGKYGIRIENLMYVERQEDGFLSFKQLTVIPYDRSLIDVQMLAKDEVEWIDIYHQFVYQCLRYSVEDTEWLRWICRSL